MITAIALDSGRPCFYDSDEDEFWIDAVLIEDDGETYLEGTRIGSKEDVLVYASVILSPPLLDITYTLGSLDDENAAKVSTGDVADLHRAVTEDLA